MYPHNKRDTKTSSSHFFFNASLSRTKRKAERSKCAARTQRALHFLLNKKAFFIPIIVVIIIVSIIIKNIISI